MNEYIRLNIEARVNLLSSSGAHIGVAICDYKPRNPRKNTKIYFDKLVKSQKINLLSFRRKPGT